MTAATAFATTEAAKLADMEAEADRSAATDVIVPETAVVKMSRAAQIDVIRSTVVTELDDLELRALLKNKPRTIASAERVARHLIAAAAPADEA